MRRPGHRMFLRRMEIELDLENVRKRFGRQRGGGLKPVRLQMVLCARPG